MIHRSSAEEVLIDEIGPPVAGAVSGGTSLIKDQAACPFRAFANHRLHADPVESPTPGLDRLNRGTLAHIAMQSLWERLRSHEQLMALSPAEAGATVAEAVDEALVRFENEKSRELEARYRRLERDRLCALLLRWLEIERERAPFVVEVLEGAESVPIGDLTINVRVDRIDRLADGRRVYIDYKTGVRSSAKWMGERPEEPQLPIYCTNSEAAAAVLFGQIMPADMKFSGLAAGEGIVPDVKPFTGHKQAQTWDELIESWRRILADIARHFTEGRAEVDPTKPACEYCELRVLCRRSSVEIETLLEESAHDNA
jgi:probable DNA repair protein